MDQADSARQLSPPLPTIELLIQLDGKHILVLPPAGGAPFDLPPVPLSLVQAVQRCQDILWQRHQRCVGVLLLLETEARRWSAQVPPQRSMSEAACWRVGRDDLDDLPADGVLAGTVQLSRADQVEDLLASVPQFDGLHLMNWHVDGKPCLFGFARVAGQVEVVAPEAVVLDEGEALAEAVEPHVTFA